MILSAQTIVARAVKDKLIAPFRLRTVHEESGMSYGLSSCGYDVRLRERLEIAPNGFSLASTLEKFNMPDDLCGLVKDKSSLARLGVAVQNTVIEPGWRGYLTLEITNHSPTERMVLLEGQPIAQVIFELLDTPTSMPYSGKYQDQPPRPVEALREGATFGITKVEPLDKVVNGDTVEAREAELDSLIFSRLRTLYMSRRLP